MQDELNNLRELHKNDLKEKLDAIKAGEGELKKIEAEIEKQTKELLLKRMSCRFVMLSFVSLIRNQGYCSTPQFVAREDL